MPSLMRYLVVASWLLAGALLAAQPSGFVPLFDGQNIDAWVQRGGKALYTVEDGAIVGTSVPQTPNSFLCTPRNYGDFELVLEFKVDAPLNSGVQIRSNCYEEPRLEKGVWRDGKTWQVKIPGGRVHGYQVEIDPSPRAWSGGIYDEGRRGWLNSLDGDKHKTARQAFKQGQWNEYRIRAAGDHLQTWVNGIPAADLHDDQTPSGFIALQVHGVGNDQEQIGKKIRWRNLRIKEL